MCVKHTLMLVSWELIEHIRLSPKRQHSLLNPLNIYNSCLRARICLPTEDFEIVHLKSLEGCFDSDIGGWEVPSECFALG